MNCYCLLNYENIKINELNCEHDGIFKAAINVALLLHASEINEIL